MPRTLRRLIAIPLLLAAGCSTRTASGPPAIDGATVYANNCNRCHEYRSPTEFDGPEWSIVTTHMRVVGNIPADESRAVFAYLKAQRHPPYLVPATERAQPASFEPADGRKLVLAHGCMGCHVVEGQGGKMGPALDGVSGRRSEAFVRRQLRDPKLNNPTSLMPNLSLRGDEIEAIWTYLQTLDGTGGG